MYIDFNFKNKYIFSPHSHPISFEMETVSKTISKILPPTPQHTHATHTTKKTTRGRLPLKFKHDGISSRYAAIFIILTRGASSVFGTSSITAEKRLLLRPWPFQLACTVFTFRFFHLVVDWWCSKHPQTACDENT